MSRALEPKIKACLKADDHTVVYRRIADVLATRYEELLDIEVLGPSHTLPQDIYFLQHLNAVAIPKVNILRAFIPAYKSLREHMDGRQDTLDELERATSVILLLDPEHLTAVNVRKRCIQSLDQSDNSTNIDRRVDRELYFIDSLLTSRLHRHTKSPTLWAHRQWLMDMCRKRRRPMPDLGSSLEKLVFVSAERHPRNYYAWCHARYLLGVTRRKDQRIGEGWEDDQGQEEEEEQQQQQQQQTMALTLETATELVKNWCFGHPNDISGWSFLMVLVQPQPQTRAAAVFSDTLHLAEAFSWRGESVWYFLRTMLRRHGTCWPDRTTCRDEFERVLVLVHGKVAERRALDEQVMRNMLDWTGLYTEADGGTGQ